MRLDTDLSAREDDVDIPSSHVNVRRRSPGI